jgi:hypothetical protein
MPVPLRQSLPPDTFGPLPDTNQEPIDLDDVELVEIISTVDNSSSQSSDELAVLKIKFPEEPMPGLKDLIPDSDGRFWCNWENCRCYFEKKDNRSGASRLQYVLININKQFLFIDCTTEDIFANTSNLFGAPSQLAAVTSARQRGNVALQDMSSQLTRIGQR